MAKANVQFTQDNEYYTPKAFVERFGTFDYDPATTTAKATEFGIPVFDTIDTDGLSRDWTPFRRIWINPPFTRKHEFLRKAWETYQKTKADIYILFPIEFVTTQRFHDTIQGGILFVPNGRIKFESGLGKPGKSPAFGSIVIKLNDTWEFIPINIKGAS